MLETYKNSQVVTNVLRRSSSSADRRVVSNASAIRWISAVVLVTALITACDRKTDSGEQLTIALSAEVQTYNPTKYSDPNSTRVLWGIFEGLVSIDGEANIVPALAERWYSNADFTEWTFKLREGVQYHQHVAPTGGVKNFGEMSAEDAVHSIHAITKGFGSFLFVNLVDGFDAFMAGTADKISGLNIKNDYEFSIRLVRPDANFVSRLTSPYLTVYPKSLDDYSASKGEWIPIGTGPLKVESKSPNAVILIRNKSYWKDVKSNVTSINFVTERNPALRIAGFKNGRYDIAEFPPGTIETGIGKQVVYSTFNTHFLAFDLEQIMDKNLRELISLSINRDEIAKKLFKGFAFGTGRPLPTMIPNFEEFPRQEFDLARAQTLAETVTLPTTSLDMVVTIGDQHGDVAQVIKQSLARVGVSVNIKMVEYGELWTALYSEEKPAIFLTNVDWIYSDAGAILEQFSSTARPNPNLTSFNDPLVDSYLVSLSSTRDTDARKELINKIGRSVANIVPAVWLYERNRMVLLSRRVSNFEVLPNNHWKLENIRVSSD